MIQRFSFAYVVRFNMPHILCGFVGFALMHSCNWDFRLVLAPSQSTVYRAIIFWRLPRGWWRIINTLRPRRNGQHFADDIFKRIFVYENVWISIKISLEFVPKGPINNIPTLVQIMTWRRPGAKPLSEPMMVSLLTHICVSRSRWDKYSDPICCVNLFVANLQPIPYMSTQCLLRMSKSITDQ